MKLARRIALLATTWLLRVTLIFGVSLLGVLYLFGRPNHLESTLQQTNAYTQFAPAIVKSLAANNNSSDGIPFKDPNVQKIFTDALPPKTVQSSAQTVIGNSYDWLEGKAPQLTFKVDFTKNRQILTDNLTAYAFNRLTTQPLCLTQPQTVNPFTADCLPRNYSIDEERSAFASEINALFPKTVYTANDLPRLSNGKSLAHDFPNAPHYYQLLSYTPWILLTLVLLLSGSIVLLCQSRKRSMKLLGSIILSSGIALIIEPLLYLVFYPHITHSLSLQSTNTGINSLETSIISSLGRQFNDFVLKGALVLVNLGMLLLFAHYLTRSGGYHVTARGAGIVSSEAAGSARGGALKSSVVPLQSSEQASSSKKTKHKARPAHKRKKKA